MLNSKEQEIMAGVGFSMQLAIQSYKNPFMKAFLNHYAQFVEQQTGVPASETIAAIMAETAKESENFRKTMSAEFDSILDYLKHREDAENAESV